MMHNVCFFVEDWSNISIESKETETKNQETCVENVQTSAITDMYGPLSGQLLTAAREACKSAFQVQPQRLMVAMYACTIKVDCDVLGKVYPVIQRRHGKVSSG